MSATVSIEFLNSCETQLKQLLISQLPQGSQFKLFGSRARGAHRWNSDYDILIETPESVSLSTQQIERIKDLIDESKIPFKVDLVSMAQCTGLFGQQIKRDAIAWK